MFYLELTKYFIDEKYTTFLLMTNIYLAMPKQHY